VRGGVKAQITLTSAEGKRLIAKAIAQLPEVRAALASGKILLKGGTTVSAVAEELVVTSMRISGRVTRRGAKTALTRGTAPHYLLIEGGEATDVEECLEDTLATMSGNDVAVIGANALDAYGNAALMAASRLGGGGGRLITGAMVEGVSIIIAVGLEKLIPGSVQEAVQAAGRKAVDFAMGAAVGLIPLMGRVITEAQALTILAPVKPTVIGRGGVHGAEGATTLVVEGTADDVRRTFSIVQGIKGTALSGDRETMTECHPGTPGCARHLGCIYLNAHLAEPDSSKD
jgi:phage gpG-like protein